MVTLGRVSESRRTGKELAMRECTLLVVLLTLFTETSPAVDQATKEEKGPDDLRIMLQHDGGARIVYGTPLVLRVRIVNAGTRETSLYWGPALLTVSFSAPDGKSFPYKPQETSVSSPVVERQLKAGGHLELARRLFLTFQSGKQEFCVPGPGQYLVVCRYQARKGDYVEGTFHIEYTEPKGGDKEVWDEISSDAPLMLAIHRGRLTEDLRSKLSRLLTANPDCSYIGKLRRLLPAKSAEGAPAATEEVASPKDTIKLFHVAIAKADIQAVDGLLSEAWVGREHFVEGLRRELAKSGASSKISIRGSNWEERQMAERVVTVTVRETTLLGERTLRQESLTTYRLIRKAEGWRIAGRRVLGNK